MKRRGFTLVEAIVVAAIMGIILLVLNSAFSEFFIGSNVSEVQTNVAGLLRDARARTLASESKMVYGVHFDMLASRAVLFRGAAYLAGDAANEPYQLPPTTAIYSINLGGPVDVVFQALTGYASASGTAVFQSKRELSRRATTTILGTGAVCAGPSC